jgi:hypothetical protein
MRTRAYLHVTGTREGNGKQDERPEGGVTSDGLNGAVDLDDWKA